MEHCAIALHLSNQEAEAVRLTGIYIPPTGTASAKRKRVDEIVAANPERSGGAKPTHVLAGDFNAPSWAAAYMEWLHGDGITELANPARPTSAAGGSLDKFLLQPGTYVPPSLLPSHPRTLREELREGETLHYPGTAVDCSHISDHIPIVLPLTYRPPQPPKGERRLRIKHLTDEDWGRKNELLTDRLEMASKRRGAVNSPNKPVARAPGPEGLFQALLKAIQAAFKPEYRDVAPQKDVDPMERFLTQNLRHPEMPYLLTALEWGDDEHTRKCISHISSDNWKRFLTQTKRQTPRLFLASWQGWRVGNEKDSLNWTCTQ